MIIIDLSRNIIKRYVAVSTPEKVTSNSDTRYGTVVSEGEDLFVMIDGSSILTPVSSNIDLKAGDRVLVLVKDHEATVLGSPTAPTARLEELRDLEEGVTEFEVILADKVGTGELVAMQALIEDLEAKDVEISGKLQAATAEIETLTAENATINGKLDVYQADIEELEAKIIDADEIAAKYATIESLESTNLDVTNLEASYGEFASATIERLDVYDADIENLETNKLDTTTANATYATIDFANIDQAAVTKIFSESGIINDLIVSEGKITGELVGVTIKGDLIEGGTVVADKLVVKGENGLYYKLNTDGVTTETEQTEYNSLSGSVITAKSITATKISVEDLVAFGATIGGFHISDNAIYSGVKERLDNTTNGIYLDKTGQVNFGDGSNYVKYFYDEATDSWKLVISADQITLGSNKTVEEYIDEKLADIDVDVNLDDYYTKTETDAQIKVSADSITQTVSETYTTKLETEDLATSTSDTRGDLGTLQSDLNATQADVTSLQNDQANTLELVSQNTEKITELVQTTSGWEYNFTTIETSVKQLNDQIVTDKDEQYKYIRFIEGEIWIGKLPEEGEDDLQLVMRNDRISFLLNNVEIAYFSDDALYVTKIQVTNSLRIGNWEFGIRLNGNLGLRWVGE